MQTSQGSHNSAYHSVYSNAWHILRSFVIWSQTAFHFSLVSPDILSPMTSILCGYTRNCQHIIHIRSTWFLILFSSQKASIMYFASGQILHIFPKSRQSLWGLLCFLNALISALLQGISCCRVIKYICLLLQPVNNLKTGCLLKFFIVALTLNTEPGQKKNVDINKPTCHSCAWKSRWVVTVVWASSLICYSSYQLGVLVAKKEEIPCSWFVETVNIIQDVRQLTESPKRQRNRLGGHAGRNNGQIISFDVSYGAL